MASLHVLGVALIVAGLVGLVLPLLPGTALIYLGAITLAAADDFSRIGWPMLVFLGVLFLLSLAADSAASLLGAKRFGASRWGLAGATLGILLGLPFGLLGIVLGPIVGAVVLEWLREPNLRQASRAGVGVLVGFVVGTAVKYAAALTMVGAIVLAYFL
ncbi:MAG: DUF456 family protein [Vicinamibacteraceae bacterium]|nr:DUF456 family protein [Vicinamibacteraceae bacterium]